MARRCRYLRGNKGTEVPKNLLFFDTESHRSPIDGRPNKEVLTLRLWCAISCRLENGKVTRRKVHYGKTQAEFWQLVQSIGSSCTSISCFAHNLGHDLTQLGFWGQLDANRFSIRPVRRNRGNAIDGKYESRPGMLCLEGPPTFIVCRDERCTYKFVDTLNYWRKSLHDLGQDFGLSKRNMPGPTDPDEDWFEYCQRDCQLIEAAVLPLLQRWLNQDCGVFQMTAPALAMTNFRHTCKVRVEDGEAIDVVTNPGGEEHDLERQAYYGGRTTCYLVGESRGTVYHLDCNSLYPFVMRKHSYPRRFVRYQHGMSHDELLSTMRCYGAVGSVLINSRYQTFPVRIDGVCYHSTGRFWSTLCGPELYRAVDSGSVDRIGLVQVYSLAPLFTEWVDYWFDRKVKAIQLGERGRGELEFVKLILNSLSGKWAQHGRKWVDVPGVYPPQRWGGWIEKDVESDTYQKWRAIGGNAQQLSSDGEPAHAFPAISAFITAHGREYMQEVIRLCPEGSIYYMATDSLICDARAFRTLESAGLLHPHDLGKFKIVGRYSECEIFGPNHYRLDDKEISAGILGRYLSRKDASGRVDLWERLPSIIADGPRQDSIVTSVPVTSIEPDFRGIIGPSGWWTPYHLTHDPEWTDRPPKSGYRREYLQGISAAHIPVIDGV